MTTEVSEPVVYCANHPTRETMLRCNRCEKPICIQCAVLTEVGYRCKECVRGQQANYYNALPYDLPVAVVVSLIAGALAGVLAYLFFGALGWFRLIGAILAGPFVGGAIAEVVRRVVRRRRARHMKLATAGATAAGVLLGGVVMAAFAWGGAGIGYLLTSVLFRLDLLLLAGLAASTVYTRTL